LCPIAADQGRVGEQQGHDVQALGDLQILQILGAVVGLGDVVEHDALQGPRDVVGEHAAPLVGLRAFDEQLDGAAQVALAEALLAEAVDDLRILVEAVDDLGQGFDALFTGHLPGGQLHGLHRGELFRTRQA